MQRETHPVWHRDLVLGCLVLDRGLCCVACMVRLVIIVHSQWTTASCMPCSHALQTKGNVALIPQGPGKKLLQKFAHEQPICFAIDYFTAAIACMHACFMVVMSSECRCRGAAAQTSPSTWRF